ncbi:MAG: hypothetical protein JEZ04_20265 [Spirochaetales bacterium]|nr:hypothetical protein [Spirochaetales bacterium]
MEILNLLQRIINAYSKKKNNWIIQFDELLAFINNLVLNDEAGRYQIFSINTSDILTAQLIDMEDSGSIALRYIDTRIDSVMNYSFLNFAVQSSYEKMESNSETPFPTEGSLDISIPDDRLQILQMPEHLSMAMSDSGGIDKKIIKLQFKGDIRPILTTGSIVNGRLLVLAVNKIRNYLAYKTNANFIYQKILPLCKQNTRALIEIIKMVQSNPGRAAKAMKKPDEFVFTFWTQLCAFIRKELSDKENKTSQDEGLLHSAVLINAFILYYRNLIIKKRQKEEALKNVGEQLKKAPYHYTISDIYSFKDKSGPFLDKKFKRDELHEFIAERGKLRENENLPEIIKVKTVNNKLYYIHRSVFLTLVHSKATDAHDDYRKIYLDQWVSALKMYKSLPEMDSDEKFHADLENRIKKDDPLLYALLAYELLYLGLQESKNIKLKAVIEGWIDKGQHSTRPLPVVLNLTRRELYAEVKSIVPFWLTIPFFRKLAAIFGKKKKKKKRGNVPLQSPAGRPEVSQFPRTTASGKSEISRGAAYRKDLEKLKIRYNYSNHTIDNYLTTLSDEWNPLYDYQARNNLVSDVKNMVRDYVRKILRETSFAVPDSERVENISELLAGNKAFDTIKKRQKFKQFISLYIIKILSETKP